MNDDRTKTYPNGHTYPSQYPPGSHWAVDAGWEILDVFVPGVISDDVRCIIAGMIAGRLMMERERAANDKTKSSEGDTGIGNQG